MSERSVEFKSATSPYDAVLVVVSKELQLVKFETRRDDIILSKLDADRLAKFILEASH